MPKGVYERRQRYICEIDGHEFRGKAEMADHLWTHVIETADRTIEHGTDRGYYQHRRWDQPFPEDEGSESCGCRAAHSRAVNENGQKWGRGFGFHRPDTDEMHGSSAWGGARWGRSSWESDEGT